MIRAGDAGALPRVGVALAVLLAAAQTAVHVANRASLDLAVLDVNAERTPFTLMSAAVIAAASLGAIVAVRRRAGRTASAGRGLAVALAFLAADELFIVHERIGVQVSALLGLSEAWDSVVWPVIYLPLLALVVVLLLRVTRSPDGARAQPRRLVLSGLALLSAAVALEVLSAPFSTESTHEGLVHALVGGLEEGCEIAGWVLVGTGLWTVRHPSPATSGRRADAG